MTQKPKDTTPVEIIPFADEYAGDFRDLNLAWVGKYFAVETKDREQLEDPRSKIIDKGGAILLARDSSGRILGCVSLVPYQSGVIELAKMAVDETAQGSGVGRMLMVAAIDKARELGARAIYLESNSALQPAVQLYERSGFRHLAPDERPQSPYARCDVYMRLEL